MKAAHKIAWIVSASIIIFLVIACLIFFHTRPTTSPEEFFRQNKDILTSLNLRLLAHNAIYRVEPVIPIELALKYQDFDSDTIKFYQEAVKIEKALGLEYIIIWRKNSKPTGELMSIVYVLNSHGIVTSSGDSTTIEFIPNINSHQVSTEGKTVITPLGVPNWFWVSYKSGSK